MSDRVVSFLLLLAGLTYAGMGLQLQVPFSYDPLGPRPVPLFLAALLVVLALLLLLRPLSIALPEAPDLLRGFWLLASLSFYLLSWNVLGFLLSTTLSLYLISRLFCCSWMQGLMTALILSVICYGLFNFMLDAPLPLGLIFTYSGG